MSETADTIRAEMQKYADEPSHWVLVRRQGIHYNDFLSIVGHQNEPEKRAFFNTLAMGQRFESKQQIKDMYLAWKQANKK